MKVTKKHIEKLISEAFATYPKFLYPWLELEEYMYSNNNVLNMVGYGSLLNKVSASRTLNVVDEELVPIICFGGKRIYNYNTPNDVVARHNGENYLGNKVACLNVKHTNNDDNYFNGLAYQIKIDEVDALRKRERGYDLIPFKCIDWNTQEPSIKYALCAERRSFDGYYYVKNDILPIPNYHKLCAEGAKAISDEFLDFFLETTYLADESTNMTNYVVE